jgi:hypothetical protein
MHGESCVRFYQDCTYLNTCQMSTSYLTSPPRMADLDTAAYQINVTLEELIDAQMKKVIPIKALPLESLPSLPSLPEFGEEML